MPFSLPHPWGNRFADFGGRSCGLKDKNQLQGVNTGLLKEWSRAPGGKEKEKVEG